MELAMMKKGPMVGAIILSVLATLAGIIVSFVIYGVTSGGNEAKKLMEDYQARLFFT